MKAQLKAQLSVAFCDVFFLSVSKSQEMLTSKPTVSSGIVNPIYWALSLDNHFVKQSTAFDSKLTKKMPTCAKWLLLLSLNKDKSGIFPDFVRYFAILWIATYSFPAEYIQWRAEIPPPINSHEYPMKYNEYPVNCHKSPLDPYNLDNHVLLLKSHRELSILAPVSIAQLPGPIQWQRGHGRSDELQEDTRAIGAIRRIFLDLDGYCR